MNDDITYHWIYLSEELPAISKRVLVTNGDTIVIASLVEKDKWIFDHAGLQEHPEGYTVKKWTELPKNI